MGTDLITLPVKPVKGKTGAGPPTTVGGVPTPQEVVVIREVRTVPIYLPRALCITYFTLCAFCILREYM